MNLHNVAMLAIALGTDLGWSERDLIDLAIGCLLHDLGMQKVEDRSFSNARILEANEYLQVEQHPLHTFDVLEPQMDRIPMASRMVAYQMHERCNGTGYPRGRKSQQTHPFAKAAAVADVFVAQLRASHCRLDGARGTADRATNCCVGPAASA